MIERELALGDSPTVQIRVRSGRVRVEPAPPGVGRFQVETRDPDFAVTQRGDLVSVAAERGGRAEVLAHLPARADLEIATTSADVDVVVPVGRLEVATASGDLTFDRAVSFRGRSASGSIRGEAVDGEAQVQTASGNVRIGALGGPGDVSTASGNVHIESSDGSLTVATVSGDVRIVRLTGPRLVARSLSGTVTLGIPPRTRLDVEATSLSGTVRLPDPSPDPQPPEREIAVKARLVSGDLRIERA